MGFPIIDNIKHPHRSPAFIPLSHTQSIHSVSPNNTQLAVRYSIGQSTLIGGRMVNLIDVQSWRWFDHSGIVLR